MHEHIQRLVQLVVHCNSRCLPLSSLPVLSTPCSAIHIATTPVYYMPICEPALNFTAPSFPHQPSCWHTRRPREAPLHPHLPAGWREGRRGEGRGEIEQKVTSKSEAQEHSMVASIDLRNSPSRLTAYCLAYLPAKLDESLIAADTIYPCSLVIHITCTPAYVSPLHSFASHVSALARTPLTNSHVCIRPL